MTFRILGLILLISSGLTAQHHFFAPYSPKSSDAIGYEQKTTPLHAAYYQVADPGELSKALRAAPSEEDGGAAFTLTLPDPTGNFSTFRILRYQMISDGLQARYPHYVTAYGWDVNAPNRKVFLEWTDLGFGASVTGGAEGRWYIAPQFWQRQDLYQSYFTSDYPSRQDAGSCGYEPDPDLMEEIAALGPPTKSVGDCQLREYDLALACTGEYYNAVGGTEALVVAEMMTAINRVNEVFRADLAITLKIINLPVDGGGVELVFNNPASDPYTNEEGATMLGENQAEIDATIGSANYDIGHVFSTGGGGIAALGSPCIPGAKAQGVTGLPNPTGDPFYIDFVAHEIGHQFGGNHTFNSTNGNCTERNASTAYEPGGGTTIQAYAGICGSAANIQLRSDPYYHAISIQEISAYMELGGGSTCANSISTANTAPTINGGSDFTIPANTPFVLTATGSDGDGDALTYCWEQFDLGAVVPGVPTGNETDAPLFRSLPPTTSPQRYFPNLPDLVASGGAQWEVLPKVARNMTFIVTLRDFGAAGYGCTVQDEVEVDVVTSTGFAVNVPNGGETWQAGGSETVTWNVAGTGNGTAVDCENVEIVLSTDGGITFDQVLATVPNTGSASVTVPSVTETDVRVMIRCSDNIFFDISNADFSIEQNDYSYTVTTGTSTACNGATTADFAFELSSLQGYTGTINYSATNLPVGVGISFTPTSTTLAANGTQAVSFTLTNLGGIAAGNYTFQVITNDGVNTKSEDYLLIVKAPLAAPTLTLPVDNGSTPAAAASFSWSAVPGATSYEWILCRNASCTSFVNAITSGTGVNFNLTGFDVSDGDGPLEWFVIARDETCTPRAETESARFNVNFGTDPPSGNSLAAGNSPIAVCEGRMTDEAFTVSFFNGDLIGPATLAVQSAPAGLQTLISPTTLNDSQTATVSFSGEENLAPGEYTITIRADDGSDTEDVDLTLTIEEDAVTINSPNNGQEVLLAPNGGCTSDGATFVTYNFDAYTGGGSVNQYVLYVSLDSGGSFPTTTVTPGANNNRGYCVDEGDMLVFYIEAELSDGSTVRSCDRTITATSNPLPVEWRSFNAAAVGKTSVLEWSVVQDAEHDTFAVERSTTSRGGWQEIASIPRSGADGLASYDYTDTEVIAGNTYFYRIRQEDLDRSVDYSEIRFVTFAASAEVVVFPNPTSDFLNLSVGSDLPDGLSYQLYSPLGQKLADGNLLPGRASIDLQNLPKAIYQLVITDGQDYQQVVRVVKH